MDKKKFLFYIKADAATWYVVSGGVVTTTTTKTPMTADPISWDTIELKWTRDIKFHGVIRSFVIPLSLCKDGATIIRHIFYTQGYNGLAYLEVEMINTNDRNYSLFYSAQIDFSQTVCSDVQVQIACQDSGLPALLRAKQNTPYSFPILDADCRRIYMDGVKLKQKVYFFPSGDMVAAVSTPERQFGPAMDLTDSEAQYLHDIVQNRPGYSGGLASVLTNNFVYTASYAGQITVAFQGVVEMHRTFPGGGGSAGRLSVAAVVTGSSTTPYYFYRGVVTSNTAVSSIANVPYTELTINVVPGETVTLVIGSEPFDNAAAPSTNAWQFKIDSNYPAKFDISFFLRLPATTVRAYRQIRVWQRLLAEMSTTAYGVQSDYLTNPALRNWGSCPYQVLMTSGDAARGLGSGSITLGGAALFKTSISDLITDGNCRDMLGLGVEGNSIRIEPLTYFYNNSQVLFELGLVSNFVVSCDPERIWNLLKIGYQYDENDSLNGKQDAWTTFQYGSDARILEKIQDQVTPAVASIYAWENRRSNLSGKDTTDDRGDSAIMLVEVSGTVDSEGRDLLYRPQNIPGNSVSGLTAADTAFNLTLMPEYLVRRNYPIIASALHLMSGSSLRFQTASQNFGVSSKLGSGLPVIQAAASIPVNSMGTPLMLPIIFELDTPVPDGFQEAIQTYPRCYGRINFSIRNPRTQQIISLGGFVDAVNIKPGRNAVCQWRLVACPDTILTDLIF